MSFEHIPGVGMVHFQTVRRPRVVPGPERHRWNREPKRGQVATCIKCGCQKCYRFTYETVYRQAGSQLVLNHRPACTGPRPEPNPDSTSDNPDTN